MDERRRRAWDALGIGPLWTLRDPLAPTRDAPDDAPARSDGDPGEGAPIGSAVAAAVRAGHDAPAIDLFDAVGSAPSHGDPRPPAEVAGTPSPQPEREAAIAAMDWDALEDAVSGCTACTLCASRRNTVFGVGPRRADWMLIGEAPGEQEDLRGEPVRRAAGAAARPDARGDRRGPARRRVRRERAEVPPARATATVNRGGRALRARTCCARSSCCGPGS
jgi:DNA polymerase